MLLVVSSVLDVADVIDVLSVVVGLLDGVDDDPSEGERDEHHDPAGEVFVQVGGLDGIHAEGAGSTSGLDGLVKTGEAGEGEWVVGESGHDPVSESLVARIAEVVCRILSMIKLRRIAEIENNLQKKNKVPFAAKPSSL